MEDPKNDAEAGATASPAPALAAKGQSAGEQTSQYGFRWSSSSSPTKNVSVPPPIDEKQPLLSIPSSSKDGTSPQASNGNSTSATTTSTTPTKPSKKTSSATYGSIGTEKSKNNDVVPSSPSETSPLLSPLSPSDTTTSSSLSSFSTPSPNHNSSSNKNNNKNNNKNEEKQQPVVVEFANESYPEANEEQRQVLLQIDSVIQEARQASKNDNDDDDDGNPSNKNSSTNVKTGTKQHRFMQVNVPFITVEQVESMRLGEKEQQNNDNNNKTNHHLSMSFGSCLGMTIFGTPLMYSMFVTTIISIGTMGGYYYALPYIISNISLLDEATINDNVLLNFLSNLELDDEELWTNRILQWFVPITSILFSYIGMIRPIRHRMECIVQERRKYVDPIALQNYIKQSVEEDIVLYVASKVDLINMQLSLVLDDMKYQFQRVLYQPHIQQQIMNIDPFMIQKIPKETPSHYVEKELHGCKDELQSIILQWENDLTSNIDTHFHEWMTSSSSSSSRSSLSLLLKEPKRYQSKMISKRLMICFIIHVIVAVGTLFGLQYVMENYLADEAMMLDSYTVWTVAGEGDTVVGEITLLTLAWILSFGIASYVTSCLLVSRVYYNDSKAIRTVTSSNEIRSIIQYHTNQLLKSYGILFLCRHDILELRMERVKYKLLELIHLSYQLEMLWSILDHDNNLSTFTTFGTKNSTKNNNTSSSSSRNVTTTGTASGAASPSSWSQMFGRLRTSTSSTSSSTSTSKTTTSSSRSSSSSSGSIVVASPPPPPSNDGSTKTSSGSSSGSVFSSYYYGFKSTTGTSSSKKVDPLDPSVHGGGGDTAKSIRTAST